MFLLKQEKQSKPRRLSFRQANTLAERIIRRAKFEEKYPKNRYSLIVLEGLDEISTTNNHINIMGIENHFTVLMLVEYIRVKILKADQKESYFLKVRNQIRRTTDNLGQLFRKFADEDGFLYVQIRKQNTF